MHPHFDFSARQILWTFTFASQLLLIVVLYGRDRARRFPFFTASAAVYAFRLLVEILLSGRMAALPLNAILISLADIAALATLLVLIEIARRSFAGLRWPPFAAGAAIIAALGALTAWKWGQWLPWNQIAGNSIIGILTGMKELAAKADLFLDVATVALGLAVVLFGRAFSGGWRTQVQKLAIGLGTVSLSWLAIQRGWQAVAESAHPHSQQEYEQLMDLGSRLVNANKVVYIAAVIWWIWWLWRDEPGSSATPAEAAAAEAPVAEEPASAPQQDSPSAEA